MGGNDTKLKIVVDAVNNAGSVFARIGSDLDTIKQRTENLRSGMMAVGIAGTAAFGGLALITKGVIEAGANFEQTQIAFETMIGSTERAQKLLADLAQFAARTPFELPQVETASKQLLAYGIQVDDLIPTLKMLGDIAAGVGMDKMPNLILAFGQVKAATRLTGMELRQFTEAGVPLLGELAKVLGVSVNKVQDMVSAGEVGFPIVQQALANLTGEGGRFQDLMDKQSQSLAGLWSNFKDQITQTARAIGVELLPYLKPLVEHLIAIVQQVGEFVKAHPQLSAAILVLSLGFAGILALLLPIALVLPGLILLFQGLAVAFTFVASGPGLMIIAIIGMLIITMINVYKTADLLLNHWNEVWLGIKLTVADVVNAVIGFVESMVNSIIDGVNLAIKALNKLISQAQKIPGIGSKIPSIGLLDQTSLSRIDTDAIAASDFKKMAPAAAPNVTVTGNTFLSEDAAEKMGDLLMSRLKLSAPI